MKARREFLKIATAATGALLSPVSVFTRPLVQSRLFGLHSSIEQNPDAVFIMKTNIDTKTNAEAVKQAGTTFGNSVFQLTDDESVGVSLDSYFPIKPNLTSWDWDAPKNVDPEKVMGIVTDVNFVEGVLQSMMSLGIQSDRLFIRDANGAENIQKMGYGAMAQRNGVDIQLGAGNPRKQWVDVPDGVWFSKIPYLWPIATPNSWLLNIAKFKAHGMGITLCAKNLQGTIAPPYVSHCTTWGNSMGIDSDHIQPNAQNNIKANYDRHKQAGIPRWEVSGKDFQGGLGMETWASRCVDNNSVLKPGLNVVEAIYGRDGNGFYQGPHNGAAEDVMTNMIIFGKNSYYVDIIGKWLAGHEPGNFGLFHIAQERGLIDNFNPHEIPLYEWNKDSEATTANLDDLTRTELLTYYIPKPGEEKWHMCDEPFDYASHVNHVATPSNFTLYQNYPNPFNGSTNIKFALLESDQVKLSIYNVLGEKVRTLIDAELSTGDHLLQWDGCDDSSQSMSSGVYLCELLSATERKVIEMTYIR